ncbi:hypothetical protein TeGR_g8188 [Tetraparma gracilis]|uniref:Threonylcarbamoyl-AMP synthase n=1 Tax=Tetraparma gracilis TaxID=2962635 RepID=A0ABQ6MJB3_9STRA|nr:hypothetical protein TeGR_g8188 [Tetraparma gracilis]
MPLAKLVPLSASTLPAVASRLASGGLVAFPTETVYGLGCSPFLPSAIASVYAAKRRPPTSPLIVHVASPPAASPLLSPSLPAASRAAFAALAARFFPGPLTLLLPAHPDLPPELTSGTGVVGVRQPAHEGARRLLEAAGPLAAPSANLHGHVSPTSAEHVMEDLGGEDVWVLDDGRGGAPEVGIESTVARIEAVGGGVGVEVLRLGAVTAKQIGECLADADIQATVSSLPLHVDPLSPSPGNTLKHYSPSLPSLILPASSSPPPDLPSAALLDYGGSNAHLSAAALFYRDLSPPASPAAAARALFAALREAEAAEGAGVVYLPDFRGVEGGEAVGDRVWRAAEGRVWGQPK